MERKQVVVVTGSSGCLGQHIVKLLQERDDTVGEIRLFDIRPYENNLGHSVEKTMTEIIADVRWKFILMDVFEGADCVIHTAADIDLDLIPNAEHMFTVNVEGTRNVIEACIEKNVPCLIFASSTAVVCGKNDIYYGTESETPIPTSFVLGKYAEFKYIAEELVLKASGTLLKNGQTKLRTASLRPTPFYGEYDTHFFYKFLSYVKKTNGYYFRISKPDEQLQISYVGNIAWAFIKAKEVLALYECTSGEAFFITDGTPVIDIHDQLVPYLEAQGAETSDLIIPYWFAWFLLIIIGIVIKFINVFWPVQFDIPTVDKVNYMCGTYTFNPNKAALLLSYQPIYTTDEAIERSLPYYSTV